MGCMKKKQQLEDCEEERGLIPGLADHIAQLILTRIQPSSLFSVCHSWRRLIYSNSFPPFPTLYAILTPTTSSSSTSSSLSFSSFDPISSTWHSLPHPPHHHLLLLRHPSFLSRTLSVQSLSASDSLLLLAATTHNLFPALPRPFLFHPSSSTWTPGPPLPTPRRWCAAGSVSGKVYVASGIGTNFSVDVAKSLERWDPKKSGSNWEKRTSLKDGRFSREPIDAVGWKGKLCMVNVKGDAAKEGAIYHVAEDLWKDMPEGMRRGWRGPVAAMDEEVMFVVDEAKGCLRRYVEEDDHWEEILVDQRLKGAEQLAAHGGRLCVVCNSGGIRVVDVAAATPRIWLVELPEGFEALAVHVLPRMPRV